MIGYGAIIMEVNPKRESLDQEEVALSEMVNSFSEKKDEFRVLEAQIA